MRTRSVGRYGLCAALLLMSGSAFAQQQGSEGRSRRSSESGGGGGGRPSWMREGKAGPWMFNFKIGPAIGAHGAAGDISATPNSQGVLMFDFGFAVDANRSAYIVFPLQFQVEGGAINSNYVIIPVGFQYDIPIHAVPGLYLYPRLSIGYARVIICCGVDGQNAGVVIPEFGAKFIFAQRWNVGFEPFALPVFFGSSNGVNFNTLYYRLLFYGGVNF